HDLLEGPEPLAGEKWLAEAKEIRQQPPKRVEGVRGETRIAHRGRRAETLHVVRVEEAPLAGDVGRDRDARPDLQLDRPPAPREGAGRRLPVPGPLLAHAAEAEAERGEDRLEDPRALVEELRVRAARHRAPQRLHEPVDPSAELVARDAERLETLLLG